MAMGEQIPTNEIEQIAELLRGIARGQMLHPDILVAAAIIRADMTLGKLLQSDKVMEGILKDIQNSADRITGALEALHEKSLKILEENIRNMDRPL